MRTESDSHSALIAYHPARPPAPPPIGLYFVIYFVPGAATQSPIYTPEAEEGCYHMIIGTDKKVKKKSIEPEGRSYYVIYAIAIQLEDFN